jgi:hypothetical protein
MRDAAAEKRADAPALLFIAGFSRCAACGERARSMPRNLGFRADECGLMRFHIVGAERNEVNKTRVSRLQIT